MSKPPYSVQLEHPFLTQLHQALVVSGDFDATEALLTQAARSRPREILLPGHDTPTSDAPDTEASLFGLHAYNVVPKAVWSRLDVEDATLSVDGEAPSPRGGHKLIYVPRDVLTGQRACLLLLGGFDGKEELADFWSFDLPTPEDPIEYKGRWSILSWNTADEGGPGSLSCHQACVNEQTGEMYVMGRFTTPGTPSTETDEVRHIPCELYKYHTRGPRAHQWEIIQEDTSVSVWFS